MTTTTRRAMLSVLVLGLAACAAKPSSPGLPFEEARTLTIDGERQAVVRIWRPATVQGVVLFSHGGGADPAAYAPLATAWAEAGFLVLAPVHVDSVANPKRAGMDLPAALAPRIADMRAISALAAREAPGKPVLAAGHSYGSVFSAMTGGALTDRGGVRDPSVKAVVMLSSPGVIPGLISDEAYAGLQTPLLLMTGDADVVPGMVPDWRAHLRAFETSPPGEKLAVIRRGGDHDLGLRTAGSPAGQAVIDTTLLFFRAHGLEDRRARRELAALRSSDIIDVRRR